MKTPGTHIYVPFQLESIFVLMSTNEPPRTSKLKNTRIFRLSLSRHVEGGGGSSIPNASQPPPQINVQGSQSSLCGYFPSKIQKKTLPARLFDSFPQLEGAEMGHSASCARLLVELAGTHGLRHSGLGPVEKSVVLEAWLGSANPRRLAPAPNPAGSETQKLWAGLSWVTLEGGQKIQFWQFSGWTSTTEPQQAKV